MQRKTLIISAVSLAIATGGWAVWNSQHLQPAASGKTQGARSEIAVTTQLVQRLTLPVVLEASGFAASLNSVEIRPQVSNLIARVPIKEGQFVKAGEILFTLDARADHANLLKAEALLAKDRAALADLQRQFARGRELRQKNFLSQSAVDTLQSQLEAQQATLGADQAALEGARVALSLDTLRSPVAGRIGAINVYPGSLVQPNAAALTTVTQLDPISVSFTLPERELARLLAAAKTDAVTIAATRPDSDWRREGRLSFIDNAVDTQSGTIRVKGQFANPDQALWPGATVGIRIALRELKDVVTIPLTAVVNAVDGAHVYTVSADNTVQRRKIEILHNFATQAAVKGMESGERLVIDGAQNLRPGVRVREAGGAASTPGARKPSPQSP
ncbi:MAG: efflux RND transporter periplasmic adaptor subunit [Betaproteobacteria bacterium]|nr:efflux RND transporter periplasmic adaptor subunit [Betaproteobacteria bacterium]